MFQIQKNGIVVDVGAHIGIFSVKAARKVSNQGRVIAIEPEKENYSLLVTNKKTNNLENIISIHGALADRSGIARLYSHKGHNGMFSIVAKHSSNYAEVPLLTLDGLSRKLNFREVDFLKIDAEGAEMEILKGGRRMLQRSNAKIVVAGYHKPADNPRVIASFLRSLGYKTTCSEDDFIYASK